MPAPSAETFVATIVGGVDFEENHRIVRFLTENGRRAAFAPGAKRSKRRFAGGLEPFTRVRATVSASRRQGLCTLTETTIDRPRLGLRRDLSVMALASYFAELADRVAPENEASQGTFQLLESALDALESGPATLALRRHFELRLAVELGYEPEPELCCVCGKKPERFFFEILKGGLRCEEHRDGCPEIGPKTRAFIMACVATPDVGAELPFDAEWARTAAARLTGTTTRFLADLLERPLKSSALLSTLELD